MSSPLRRTYTLGLQDIADKEIVDSKLRPPCATYNEYTSCLNVKQNFAGISAVTFVVFYRRLQGIDAHDAP